MIVRFNLILFLFNLLPFFPIDGWHILLALLPPDLAYTWQRNAQNTQYLLLGLIMLSFLGSNFNILGMIIGGPLSFLQQLLLGF
jgi:Zn-dependent protease